MNNELFAKFATTVGAVAQDWPENIPDYQNEPGSAQVYQEATETLFERISEDSPESLQTSGVEHGLIVMNNFLYILATKASEAGMTKIGLDVAARHPDTFHWLGRIATHSNAVATAMEKELGLSVYSSSIDNSHLDHYKMSGYKLFIKDFARVKDNATLEAARRGRPVEAEQTVQPGCPAHRNKTVEKVYKSLVSICVKDPNLFEASLSRPQK